MCIYIYVNDPTYIFGLDVLHLAAPGQPGYSVQGGAVGGGCSGWG